MRSVRRWLRSHPWLAAATLTCAVVALLIVPWSSNPVTRANFRRIRIGMSHAELHSLLGAPELQAVELGLVDGPETYWVHFGHFGEEELRRRGFRDYQRQQWASSEITIIVISDLEGRVICRYSGEGREPYWLALLRSWLS